MFTKAHPNHPLAYTQLTTQHILPLSLLSLAPHLLHITHGL